MADETSTTEAPEVETPAAEAPKPQGDVPPEVKRALAKANKEAEALRLELKEFKDRDKTEAEKVAERATTAEQRATAAETALARLEVALEKGLTPNQAKRLVGATREELEADADELLKDLGDASKPRSPRPDPNQGGATRAVPLDPRSADLAQIEADLKAGSRR